MEVTQRKLRLLRDTAHNKAPPAEINKKLTCAEGALGKRY